MTAPADPHRQCPTCGRGPFWQVHQRVPAGAPFMIMWLNVPQGSKAAGLIMPSSSSDGAHAQQINGGTQAWMPGDRVERTDNGTWKLIRG